MPENVILVGGPASSGQTALPVTGTVTTSPSGQQHVLVDGQPVSVTGTVTTTPSGQQHVLIDSQPISTTGTITGTVTTNATVTNQPFVNAVPAKDPLVTGVYNFSAQDIAGVVASTNYVVLFNPVGSGKNLLPLSTTVSDYIVTGTVAGAHSLTIQRCTLVSGGTLQSASAINKLISSYAAPVAQVYTGNPTLTAGAAIVAIPPAVNTNGAAVILEHLSGPPGAGPFVLAPGEGVAYSMSAGNVNLNFNIAFTWGEQ